MPTILERETFADGMYGEYLFNMIQTISVCEICKIKPPIHAICFDVMSDPEEKYVCEDCYMPTMNSIKQELRGSSVPSLDGWGKTMSIGGGNHNC